jgi:hypothetical protein
MEYVEDPSTIFDDNMILTYEAMCQVFSGLALMECYYNGEKTAAITIIADPDQPNKQHIGLLFPTESMVAMLRDRVGKRFIDDGSGVDS